MEVSLFEIALDRERQIVKKVSGLITPLDRQPSLRAPSLSIVIDRKDPFCEKGNSIQTGIPNGEQIDWQQTINNRNRKSYKFKVA